MPPNASVVFSNKETIRTVPWRSAVLPNKILVMRLQAFGDVAVTLPYVQALQTILPSAQFHFLTREEFDSLPCNMAMFSRVLRIAGGRDPRRQWLRAFVCLPSLRHEHYDIVIDLQRNSLSRMIRRALHPKSFCEYDRFSMLTAGERTKNTVDKLGFLPLPNLLPRLALRDSDSGLEKLLSSNFNPAKKMFVLNPAGNYITKNWPLEHYAQFARTWLETIDGNVQFIVLGTDIIRAKAEYLKNRLGRDLIILIGSTTQAEAFNILQKADFALTEDSGLMHLAWISQIPVIALLGSTRSEWSRPLGPWSVCMDSSDLECGGCLQQICRFGDVRCLTRYSVDMVIKIAIELLQKRHPND
ncbi:MAG: glycosyltransferase family 9 protein [Bacteroidota bacterium]